MIVRVSPQLFSQLKHNAKRKNLSLNAYVEQELALIAKPKLPKLPKDFQADPVLASFSGLIPMTIVSPEEFLEAMQDN